MSELTAEDYCQTPIEDEGIYRAFPVAWTVKKYDSGSVAIAYRLAIHEKWHGKDQGWSEQYTPGWYTEHHAWIIKKPIEADPQNGIEARPAELNTKTQARLMECKLWDGDFDSLENEKPPSTFVLIDVGADTHDGKTRYRADWVNPNADEPRGRGGYEPADRGLLNDLKARFGSKARAVAGGKPPAGKAPAPPKPGAGAPPKPNIGGGATETATPGDTKVGPPDGAGVQEPTGEADDPVVGDGDKPPF